MNNREMAFMHHSAQSKDHKKVVVKGSYKRVSPAQWVLIPCGLVILVLVSLNMYSFPRSVLFLAVASIGSVTSLNVTEPSKACSTFGDSLNVDNAVVQISSFVPAGTEVFFSGGK